MSLDKSLYEKALASLRKKAEESLRARQAKIRERYEQYVQELEERFNNIVETFATMIRE
ncbi:MAG: hypothetical protein QXS85_06115 [Acidilobaceae archaeon]